MNVLEDVVGIEFIEDGKVIAKAVRQGGGIFDGDIIANSSDSPTPVIARMMKSDGSVMELPVSVEPWKMNALILNFPTWPNGKDKPRMIAGYKLELTL